MPVTFFLDAGAAAARARVLGDRRSSLFGTLWIGLALAHAVLLRDLPHGGSLVVDVLLGTFLGDTAAYFGGRAFGRHPAGAADLAEQDARGAARAASWAARSRSGCSRSATTTGSAASDALLIGVAVALAAPIGDLFESLIKRDLEVKDTGRLFGAHGGALDRLDAVLFTVVTAYYVSVAVL